ncbi:hypothetical protein A2V49_03790 [candidate division WWE3 bacterium RBG_19FT_COMBO_34_6]|uniref:M23ase beta-sheet core domain-containing protein n=1 Tax=candidate division WWE3 bacterium RBG_19FT_COMBO_34_6 TaxID=1802612 RepID=A0A1F4ULB6_UNCKA|nr:MAG: hypothetical protein A2V49_03790 [candidate division WWE3 bacterium RBG_19FT_COMBO_34_6]
MHDAYPDEYNKFITNLLGLSGGTWYSLPDNVEDFIISLGFDPAVVANEIMANRWINENGGEIDLGIQLAILEGESGGGENLGTCSGLAAAANFSQQEVDSARWLLEHWKNAGVRNWSEIARLMIKSDYSDYTGHCAAGEIGPNGILPSTGVIICKNGLSLHNDPIVQSCNFFDYRVAPYAKNWWLKAINYRSNQSESEKFTSLYGWNHDEQYRLSLLSRAGELNLAIGDSDFSPGSNYAYLFSGNWLQKAAVSFLKSMGLLTGDVFAGYNDPIDDDDDDGTVIIGDFADPYPGGFTCGYGYGVPIGNGIHWGIDLCFGNPWKSAPIYAMHSGTVTFARYLSPSEPLAGYWWISGNVVAIEGKDNEGNTIWTAYGHGTNGSIIVSEGDIVEAGDKLMMSGSTGFSSGIHLHLAMKINGNWVNPTNYLGGD